MSARRASQDLVDRSRIVAKDGYRMCRRITYKYVVPILLFLGYSVCGAVLFTHVEGQHEIDSLHEFLEFQNDFIEDLWTTAKEDKYSKAEWTNRSLQLLVEFEDVRGHLLQPNFPLGGSEDDRQWDYWGSLIFCATIYTTIGYGHLIPRTTGGRAATVIYAVFGIPLCMTVLMVFGNLMTLTLRKIHWLLWRLYTYGRATGQVVGTAAGQFAGQAKTMVGGKRYSLDIARSRHDEKAREHVATDDVELHGLVNTNEHHRASAYENDMRSGNESETENATTETSFVVDDVESRVTESDFNPSPVFSISVLIIYIFLGAFMYCHWENWTYFESAYFIFISLSTIGFGDVLPSHTKYFIASSLYIFFGLTLVSFVINTILLALQRAWQRAKKARKRLQNQVREKLKYSQK